jgi:hypothetical protein
MNAVLRVKKKGFAFKHASFYNEELTTRLMSALCLLIITAPGWLQNKQLSYYSGGFAHFRDTVGMPQSPPTSPNMRRSMPPAILLSDNSSLLAQPPLQQCSVSKPHNMSPIISPAPSPAAVLDKMIAVVPVTRMLSAPCAHQRRAPRRPRQYPYPSPAARFSCPSTSFPTQASSMGMCLTCRVMTP